MKTHLLLLGMALSAGAPALYAQNEIGEVFSSDASVRGSVVLSGNGARVLSGSQISAGEGAALLKLERGGEVRICPRSELSVSVDSSGKALVLGMNAGAMELNYSLQTAADSLLTPDFRLQLISPGNFHLAISVSPSGDTCMRSLPGNDASVFVAEMMGNGAYQLSPGKNVLFKAGRISGAKDAPSSCGCPEIKAEVASPIPATEAARPAGTPSKDASVARSAATTVATSADTSAAGLATPETSTNEASTPAVSVAASASNPAEPHLEVESSFVYRGDEAVQDYYTSVSRLSLSKDNSGLALALLPKVSEPAAKTKAVEQRAGVFHRLGRLLGRMFGK